MKTRKPRMPSLDSVKGMAMPKAKAGSKAAKPTKQVKTPAPKMMKTKAAMPMAPSFGGKRRKGASF